jgi:chromosomal replication initiation ATPase DnaA
MNSPCLFLRRLGVDDLETGPAPTMLQIASDVARRHGLRLADLKGRLRDDRTAHARQEAMALIFAQGRYGYSQIGRFLDHDRTTVRHGVEVHAARLAAMREEA